MVDVVDVPDIVIAPHVASPDGSIFARSSSTLFASSSSVHASTGAVNGHSSESFTPASTVIMGLGLMLAVALFILFIYILVKS